MSRIEIPHAPRRRRNLFALTPLIDVMFLLLIFFMLSSQIAPYSLLPVSSVAGGRSVPASPVQAGAASPILVRVARGEVTLDGEAVLLSKLEHAFARSVASSNGSFLVLPSRTATVQDLVTVLEALKMAAARDVALYGGTGAEP